MTRGTEKRNQTGMNIVMHEILDGANIKTFDPTLIVGMVSIDQKSLTISALDKQIPLKDKAELEIPRINFGVKNAATIIKSVQLKEQDGDATAVFVEMSGPATPKVFAWIESLAAHMKEIGLVNAFFPAYKTVEPTNVVFGAMKKGRVSNWNTLPDINVKNVRILKGNAVLFNAGNTLYSIPFTSIEKRDWKSASKVLYTYEDTIAFIGRVKDGIVPITLHNKKSYKAEVNYSSSASSSTKDSRATNSVGLRESVSSLIGPIGPGILAAISEGGNSLLLMPATGRAAA